LVAVVALVEAEDAEAEADDALEALLFSDVFAAFWLARAAAALAALLDSEVAALVALVEAAVA
jgi:hypothetical protein